MERGRTGTGRNIRHLPCVSRRSGETGVCMFAFTCAKANGTHLGTCIDRFYFGSCCKIDDEPDIFPQDNSIDDGPPASRPFITTHRPTGSSGIPEYFTKPKPTDEKKPVEASQITTISGFLNTQSTQTSANTMRDTTKFVTKKPITTIEMTTQTTRLSTFQTVQNAAGSSTEATLKATNNTVNIPANISPSITRQPTKPTILDSTYRPSTLNLTKLTTITSETTAKKPISMITVQKPTVQTSQKPFSSTARPIVQHESTTTTIKNVLTVTTQKVVPSTRFPPRNTTSIKPLNQTTTRKPSTKRPSTTVTTKRPVVTTKKPTTLTKRPSTSTKPLTNSSFGTTLPAITKPHSTSGSFSNGSFSTSADRATESTLASTGIKPSIATTATTNTIQKTTITPTNLDHKGSTKTTTPKTTLKPTSTVRTTTARPSTTTKTTINRPVTTKPSLSTTTKLKPTKTTSTTTKITRPEYTSATTTTEGSKPLSSTVGSTVSVTKPRPSTTKPTPLTKLPVNTSSIVEVTTSISSSISTFTVRNESTSTHVTPIKDQNVNHTLEEIPLTTYSPGLVTWSSNSDEVSTKASNKTISSTSTSTSSTPMPTSTSTSTSTLTLTSTSTVASSSEQVETDWSPITTSVGWIMIQSPTTEKLPETQESSTEPVTESPIQSLTSVKPITESSIISDIIKRPTVTTLLSTIASVTIDMELPVPIETLNMSDYKQVCGRRMFPEPKIVGGERSSFGKWPWQISLRQWRSQTYLHKCGAALLNENWAITAAHCVESVPPSELLLRIGEHDLANEDEPYGYQERRVQIVASHPQFDARTFEYDLALLRFYDPLLPFQPNVLPICLPDDDETYVGRTAYVTGWGRLYDEGPLPSVLQEVAVPVINNTVCEAMYKNAGYIEHIPHIFICAGWRNGGFDSCEGDSGGPMVIQRARDKRWILAGIISWGIGCAAPNQPGVYTRISEFRDWINQILQF
ncbi:PREDICTED: serine proteinase stubble-like isoform X2 [Acromyrmex echinatior]|uniref:serine proteinase stubble-like isoform X2 n=1 Tax=Acromyrmex echinatior TaxID=103372 RepID=UPI000580C986|nr:PREDICTED: serine proteinase stubble-like isoform X2 [Acromyrmex echinatior]